MTDKNIIFLRSGDNELQVDVCAISDWNGYDKLIKFVQEYYNAEIVVSLDGPDGSRRCVLECDHIKFELIHDDFYGNYFLASTPNSEELIRKIGEDLEQRLKNI